MSDEPDGVVRNAAAALPPEPALPRWRPDGVVEADRITGVSEGSELALFRWHLACGATVDVHQWLAARVAPETSPIGGFYMKFADGFENWSPASLFEASYARIATEA